MRRILNVNKDMFRDLVGGTVGGKIDSEVQRPAPKSARSHGDGSTFQRSWRHESGAGHELEQDGVHDPTCI